MTTQRPGQLQNGVTLRPVQVSTLSNFNHHSLRGGGRMRQPQQILHHQEGGPLEAPITIALQGGDQFVSLQIDKHHHPNNYAPVHLNH